jgi:hypothetical protein
VDTRDGYARLGRDLLQRLAGQVELDRVVKLRRVEWSGHVYSLTSSEGWHCANSLIVSNCDCLQIPSTDKKLTADLRTDPKLYFESLSVADQNKYFGAGRAEQIRQGADISQTVAVKSQAAGLSSPGSESIARPMPAALIAEGRGDRDETVRLLRQHGFVD